LEKQNSKAKTIKVSVVIPAYKDDERLNKCIEALNKQTCPKEHFEVIIVNNDTHSDINIAVDHSLNLNTYRQTKPGSYAARNLGIKHAKGEILAFTDSDCIPSKEWIANAIEKFAHSNYLLRVAGKVSTYQSDGTPYIIFLYQQLFSMQQEKYVNKYGYAMTANLFVKKKVFDKVGLFRDDLYSGGDDEWGRRVTHFGFNMKYAQDVVVKHPSRNSLKQLLQKKIRTTGGVYQIRFCYLNKVSKIKNLLVRLLPPIKKINNLNIELTLTNKLKLFFIDWLHGIISFLELVKLLFFNRWFRRT